MKLRFHFNLLSFLQLIWRVADGREGAPPIQRPPPENRGEPRAIGTETTLREGGLDDVIQSQAVLIAFGIDSDGRRQILGFVLAHRESRSSCREVLESLKERGLDEGIASIPGALDQFCRTRRTQLTCIRWASTIRPDLTRDGLIRGRLSICAGAAAGPTINQCAGGRAARSPYAGRRAAGCAFAEG